VTRVRQRWTLAAACFAQFMILLDVTIVNVALPSIQRELDVSTVDLVWTINAYVLALASLILVGGTLDDRYRRKRIFVLGFVVFTIFSAACALATSDSMLIAFRAFQGVGAALLALDHRRRVPARTASMGDRDLGNRRRPRLRRRADSRRRAHQRLRLVGHLLGQRPVRHRRCVRHARVRPRVTGSRGPPARPRRGRSRCDCSLLLHVRPRRDGRARLDVGVHARAPGGGRCARGGICRLRGAAP
jgi:Major Facilitator Superfamily